MANGMGGFFAGSIFAKLLLDKTGWNQSVQSVVKDEKTLSMTMLKIGSSMATVGKKMTVAGASISATFGVMIKKTADYGDQLNDMSKRTGIATDLLSGYKLAADKSGTSLEGLAVGMRGLANQMQSANSGSKEAKRLFDLLGISYTDNEGRLRPLNDVMLDVADRFSKMEDGAQKTALAQDTFGRSGMELIPMLNLGAEGLRKERDEAEKLGMVFSQDAAQSCDDFNDSLASLKGALGGAAKEIGISLLPMAKSLVDTVTTVVSKMREWAAAHPGLASALSSTGLVIGGMLTGIGTFAVLIGTVISKLAVLASTIGTTAGALTASVAVWSAATAALGFYIAKLIELKNAEDYATEAENRLHQTQNKLVESLSKAAVAADWQYGRMSKLIEAYHGNIAALAMAIQRGKEGKDIQEALAKVSREEAEAIKKQREEHGLLNPVIDAGAKAAKTWGEILKEYGVIPVKEKTARIAELLDHEQKLIGMLRDGAVDSIEFGDGIKAINDELKELGSTTKTLVLPTTKEFLSGLETTRGKLSLVTDGVGTLDQQMKVYGDRMGWSTATVQAFTYEIARMQLAMAGIVLPPLDFTSYVAGAHQTTSEMGQAFDNLWSDVAAGFGRTFQDILSGATGMKDALGQIWGNIKDAFFSMCGEIVTKWVKGVLIDIVSGAANAAGEAASNIAKTATSAVSGISGILSGGLAPAIGSFVGSFLAGVLGGGPSGHQQQQQINDTKDIRNKAFDIHNWLISVGANIERHIVGIHNERFDGVYTKFDGLKGSVDLTRTTLSGNLKDISEKLGNLKSAQGGAFSTTNELVMVHGTPTRPEYIIPAPNLMQMVASAKSPEPESKGKGNVTVNVNLHGQIITDREWTRRRLLDQIASAVTAGVKKTELQSAFGVR